MRTTVESATGLQPDPGEALETGMPTHISGIRNGEHQQRSHSSTSRPGLVGGGDHVGTAHHLGSAGRPVAQPLPAGSLGAWDRRPTLARERGKAQTDHNEQLVPGVGIKLPSRPFNPPPD